MTKASDSSKKSVLHQHMQQLGNRMDELHRTFHSFENKFLFGGIIAIIAILNTDLIFAEKIKASNAVFLLLLFLASAAVSATYFWRVAVRLNNFHHYFRSVKYHYELTYYALLLDATTEEYLKWLEHSLKAGESSEISLPADKSFSEMAQYLFNHHKEHFEKSHWVSYIGIPMALVLIVLIMKVIIYA